MRKLKKIFVLTLVISFVLTFTTVAFAESYSEDFSDGIGAFKAIDNPDIEAVKGDWVNVDGSLVQQRELLDEDGGWFEANAVYDGYLLGDSYTVEVDLKSDTAFWTGIHLQKENPNDAIFNSGFILFLSNDALFLTDSVEGANETIQGVQSEAVNIGEMNTIKVVVDGTYAEFFINDEFAFSADHERFGYQGYVGLVAGGGTSTFDNFYVEGATYQAADEGTQEDTQEDDTAPATSDPSMAMYFAGAGLSLLGLGALKKRSKK